jgi:hypothetical protein
MWLIGTLLIILIIVMILKNRNPIQAENQKEVSISSNTVLPYKSKYLLTKTEYSFYNSLKPICDNHKCLICPKVGLKDIVDVTDKSNYYKWFGRINQKHIDFLICDDKLKPLFAIELDDWTHTKEKAYKNDDFKNALFSKINIPLKRVNVSNTYENLESVIFPQLN